MAVRMGPRLRYRFDAPDDLRRHPVPPLLLQPLVENAIRHSLEPRVEGGQITVGARREGTRWLRIEIADTGVGMETQAASAKAAPSDMPAHAAEGGFGLALVRERVAGLAGGPGELHVESRHGTGTTVHLHLPLTEPPAAP